MALPTSNFKDVATQFASAVTGRGFYVVLQVVLARSLGPRDYGLYALGWTVAGLLSTFAPAGMPQAVLRFGLAGRRSLRSLPLLVAALAGSVLAAGVFASADLIAASVFGEPEAAGVIRAFAPAVPLISVFMVLAAALRASGAMLSSAVVSGLLFAVYLATTALAFAVAPSATVAAHMYSLSILVALACAVVLLLPHAPPAAGTTPTKVLLHFGLVTMFIHSANVFNLWADRFVVGMVSDAETLGVYQAASQLAMVVIVLRSAVTVVFEAAITRTRAGDGVRDVSAEFYAAARILLHACGPGLVVLAITAKFWIDLLFGPEFDSAAPVLAILVLGQLAVTFCGPSITALHMTGKERLVMALTLGGCLLNVLANVALIPVFGAAGAAIGASAANATVALVCLLVLAGSGRLRFSFPQLHDILVGLSVCAVFSVVVTSVVGDMSLLKVVPIVLAAYCLYLLVIHKLCAVDDEVLGFVRDATRRYARRQA